MGKKKWNKLIKRGPYELPYTSSCHFHGPWLALANLHMFSLTTVG